MDDSFNDFPGPFAPAQLASDSQHPRLYFVSDGNAHMPPSRDANDASSTSDEPVARKRRRNRRGLGQRFQCSADGCGKTYSRAEHLHRHELNHSDTQMYRCQLPDCPRTFYRGDLLRRHMDRHAAKSSKLAHVEPSASRKPQMSDPVESPVLRAVPLPQPHDTSDSTYSQGQAPSQVPHTPASSAPLTTHSRRPSYAENSPHDDAGRYPFAIPRPGLDDGSVALGAPSHHPSNYTESSPRDSGQTVLHLSQSVNREAADMMTLDRMAVSGVGPVFGEGQDVNKSSYVGMPAEFMEYIFGSLPNGGSSVCQQSPSMVDTSCNYSELPIHQFDASYHGSQDASHIDYSTAPQQIMAVNNLLYSDGPEAVISDDNSRHLFDFIRDRFHEDDVQPAHRQRDSIVAGDRSQDDHVLSRRMMQAYVCSYWQHFSDQLPVLHRPTFSAETTPTLLLLAIMTLGAACLHRTRQEQPGVDVARFLARGLRWEIFKHHNFQPPAKLWIFQALVLLELYEKMYSSRELHERAHIHHATTITLMRRGRSLLGKSSLESSPNPGDGLQRGCYSAAQTCDEWWTRWINSEATRRIAFAAFIVDTMHATMFGHSLVMVAHEMRLPLPCDETLWEATSSAEVLRIDANLTNKGVKPILFVEGLRRTLNHQPVRTTPYGRLTLMAGLLSVTFHMHQRDAQCRALASNALRGWDSWQATLTRAYDSWKADFDGAHEDSEATNDPYRPRTARNGVNVILASRTVLHHLAHMAMHADIVDCQKFARARCLLGRSVGRQDLNSTQHRMENEWVGTAQAREATFHALKLLSSVLLASPAPGVPHVPGLALYEARHDVLMDRSWVLYFAALVVWCYGFASEGPCSEDEAHIATPSEARWHMRSFLQQHGCMTDASELCHAQGLNRNTALLVVLRDSFVKSHWALLEEASRLLKNCLILNAGGTIP